MQSIKELRADATKAVIATENCKTVEGASASGIIATLIGLTAEICEREDRIIELLEATSTATWRRETNQ